MAQRKTKPNDESTIPSNTRPLSLSCALYAALDTRLPDNFEIATLVVRDSFPQVDHEWSRVLRLLRRAQAAFRGMEAGDRRIDAEADSLLGLVEIQGVVRQEH